MAKSYSSIKAGWNNNEQGTGIGRRKSYRDIKSSDIDYGVDESYVNSFLSNSQDYMKNAQKDSGSISYGNHASQYERYSSAYQDLSEMANNIRGYYNSRKSEINEKDYNDMMNYLDSFKKGSNDVVDFYRRKSDYYSGFKSEDEYNQVMKAQKEYDDMLAYDLVEGQKELDNLKSTRDKVEEISKQRTKLTYDDYYSAYKREFGEKKAKKFAEEAVNADNLKYYPVDKEIDKYLSETGYTSLDELNSAINQKEVYYNNASRVQSQKKLNDDALNSADFKEYSNIGREYANQKTGIFEKNKNEVGVYRNDENRIKNYESFALNQGMAKKTILLDDIVYKAAKYMNDEEYGIYSYYIGKGDGETAKKYLDSIEEKLNLRQGNQMYAEIEGNALGEIFFGYQAGIDQFRSGVTNVFNTEDDYIPVSGVQYASGMVREDLANIGPEVLGNSLGQIAYDTVTTTSNMMPSVLTSLAIGSLGGTAGAGFLSGVGRAAGSGLMFGSAAGNAYQEMINQGYSKDQARVYSNITGASEVLLQEIMGGIPGLRGVLTDKAIKSFASGLNKAGLRFAVSFAGNAYAEGMEEFLQEVLEPYIKAFATGEAPEDIDWEDAIYSGLLGALSSASFGGAEGIANGVSQREYYKNNFGDVQKEIVSEGLSSEQGTLSRTLAEKYNKQIEKGRDLRGGQLQKIIEANERDAISSDIKKIAAGVENRLTELGENANVKELAMVIAKETAGTKLSSKEIATLENGKYTERVRNELNAQNIKNGTYSSAWAEKLNTRRVNAEAYGMENKNSSAKANVYEKLGTTEEKIAEKVSETGNTEITAEKSEVSSDSVSIKSIKSIDSGKMMLEMNDGTVVDSNDVKYASEDEALIYESCLAAGYSAMSANAIVNGFKGTNLSASQYMLGIEEAYRYGKYGYPISRIRKTGFISELTDTEMEFAYNLGMSDSNTVTKAKNESVKNKGKTDKKRKGRVVLTGPLKTATERQKASLSAIGRVVADITHNDVVIYESVERDGKRVFSDDIAGNRAGEEAPNGFYDTNTGAIYIDINAGNHGEGAILWTAAHELTHFVHQWSPEKFKVLSDFLMEEYGKNGVDINELIQNQIEKAKRKGRKLSYDVAFEEVVADSMETMFTDTNLSEKLAKLKAKDETLWGKIKSFFADLYNKLKSEYSKLDPQTTEGRLVHEMMNSIEKISDLFAEAIVDAGENFSNIDSLSSSEETNNLYSGRDYSYEHLISKPDIKPTLVDFSKPLNRADTVVEAKKNIAKIGKKNSDGSLSVKVKDIGRDVIVTTDSLRHGLHRNLNVISPITIQIGDILENSIRINEMNPKKAEADFSYALIGVATDRLNNLYVVRSMVNSYSNEVSHVDVLYAVNTKKEMAATKSPRFTNKNSLSFTISNVSVSDLLDIVNKHFPDVLSESVLRHYGHRERPDGEVGKYALYSDRDSAGNELSKEQQDFFAESKIRDKEGNLQVMYHGSPETFTVFDKNKAKYSGLYGRGFYFTNSSSHASQYGGNYEVYLNIKNPLSQGTKNITKEQLREFVQMIADNDDYGIENYGYNATVDSVVNDIFGKDDFSIISDINATCIGDMVEAVKLFNDVAGTDYDGIVVPTETVAFYPNQIKNTSNINPTSDPDIRYSGRINSIEEKKYDEMKSHFGTTNNFRVAGYLLKDGTMLDFSGKHWGDTTSDYRQVDHRDINEVLDESEDYDAMVQMIANGNIRLMPETGGICLSQAPTEKQRAILRNYIKMFSQHYRDSDGVVVDFDEPGGDTVYSRTYSKGTDTRTILRDIDNYFKGGKQSELMQFHQMHSDRDKKAIDTRTLLYNALEATAQNENEKKLLSTYKTQIDILNKQQNELTKIRKEIKDISFGKGTDRSKLPELKQKAETLANAITRQDRKLLNLEANRNIKAVLEREKAIAKREGNEVISAYRERALNAQKEIVDRYRESIKNSREGRKKTELRHKIIKKVKELNKLLLNGTKERHVSISLNVATIKALQSINMDTIAADKRLNGYTDENGTYHKGLYQKLKETSEPEKEKEIQDTINRIEEQGERMAGKMQILSDAYSSIEESSDPLLRNVYEEEILKKIEEVRKEVGDTPLRLMSKRQLEEVYDMYKMVYHIICTSNKAFAMERKESVSRLGESVYRQITQSGKAKDKTVAALDPAKEFFWNNMKPVYAMKHIGSETLMELFDNVRKGEDTWAVDVSAARQYFLNKSKEYGYKNWDFDKRIPFKTKNGRDFDLSLQEIMSLYAYMKRPQAKDHIVIGGFVFDDAIVTEKKHGLPVKYKINTAKAHNISDTTFENIINTLTEEQKKFVDDMQGYLSNELSAKGNEVSRALYDIDLFKEKNYFPIKSAEQFMYEKNVQEKGEVKIKNSGFTKKTTPKANNPIILRGFMDVWSEHVNDMSMYHAFVLPLEDFNRVWQYSTPTNAQYEPVGVRQAIKDVYGDHANKYIHKMLKDLNGGARSDTGAGLVNKMTSLFKKGAVFASASVVIQQPSAIARTWAYINPKYFAKTITESWNPKKHSDNWNEVKKYAPIAIIKEMGYFDTNMGKQTTDWITSVGYEGIKEKMKALVTDSNYRDEVLSKAPAVADELAWTHIWNAVKKEVAEKTNLAEDSEEFFNACGKKFTEVIVNTQVYDSVLSRSALMRSKDTGVKMATAFMAEPTTSINMIQDALIQAKRTGDGKRARVIIGSVVGQIILNSILVSLVYASRDDDDEKSYAEKYTKALFGSITDSINPMSMIPYLRDIMSLVQGYDVERSDMSVISGIVKGWENLFKDSYSPYKKVETFAGSIANLFGLPLKNIMRDCRGMYNIAKTLLSDNETTAEGIMYSAIEGITGDSESKQIKNKLMNSIAREDYKKISSYSGELIDYYVKSGKNEKEARTAIKTALTSEWKPKFLKAYNQNDNEEMAKIRKSLHATGIYDDVVETTQNWIKDSKK